MRHTGGQIDAIGAMKPPQDIDERLGLQMPLDEAVTRFVDASLLHEGEVTNLVFKGVPVRKILHNGEWWFSITDIVGALTGTDRASKYWSDLKRKLVDKEGFFELSDKIGQPPLVSTDGKKLAGGAGLRAGMGRSANG